MMPPYPSPSAIPPMEAAVAAAHHPLFPNVLTAWRKILGFPSPFRGGTGPWPPPLLA
jgi:hypothetical protein